MLADPPDLYYYCSLSYIYLTIKYKPKKYLILKIYFYLYFPYSRIMLLSHNLTYFSI